MTSHSHKANMSPLFPECKHISLDRLCPGAWMRPCFLVALSTFLDPVHDAEAVCLTEP